MKPSQGGAPWFFSLIDPFLVVDAKVRKRLEQLDLQVLRYSLGVQALIWPLIYIAHYYINDQAKRPLSLYFKYRFGMAAAIFTLGLIGRLFRNNSTILRLCLIFLASLLCYVQSWSMTLGPYISHSYLVLLPLIVLVSFSRSYIFPALWLIFLIYTSRYFWGSHTEVRFIFSDTTIALFVMFGIHIVRRVWLNSRIVQWKNDDLHVEALSAQVTFDRQIKSFISPVLIRNIEVMTARGSSFIAALDSVLKRRKSTVAALFSDMRNFSSRSDDIDFVEQELVPSASRIIDSAEQNNGIAKQLGDAVLVYYSLDDPEEALLRCLKDATRCALEEAARIASLGRPQAERYFTVTFGTALVGNMASARHRESTIIGSPANLAARIDALTKESGILRAIDGRTGILLAQSAWETIQTFSPEWDVQQIDLSILGLEIRSYLDQTAVFFLPSGISNVSLLNKLLALNGIEPMKIHGNNND